MAMSQRDREAAIARQKGRQEREKEALRWVERLLEPGVTDNLLIQAGQCTSQCHYSDVVDERNIEGLCGYPGCSRQLGPVSRQKYHISLERKQVFDLTERKKFCSNECYKSSKFYLSQLSAVPVWARDKEKIPIKLLPASGVNHQPSDRPSNTATQPSDTSTQPSDTSTQPSDTSTQPSDTSTQPSDTSTQPSDTPTQPHDTSTQPSDTPTQPSDTSTQPSDTFTQPRDTSTQPSDTSTQPRDTSTRPSDTSTQPSDTPTQPSNTSTDQCTDTTELTAPVTITERSHPPAGGTVLPASLHQHSDHNHQPAPVTITECSHPLDDVDIQIASLELVGDDTEEQLSVQPPKLSTVGRLLHTFNSWCTAETLELLHSGPLEVGGDGSRSQPPEDRVFLPPLPSASQSQLQRNILMQQLKRNLSVVTGQLGVDAHQVLPQLTALMKTFRLDRHTITFRPTEWKVILLVLLQCTHPEQEFISCHKTQVDTWLADINCSREEMKLMIQIFIPPEEQRTNY